MQSGTQAFEGILLPALPTQYLTPEGKKKFADIAQKLDQLGKVNPQTQEIFIDEQTLRNLLKTHLPAGVEDHCMLALKAASANSFIAANTVGGASQQHLNPLSWQQLSQEIKKKMKTPSVDDSQLGSSPTAEKLIQTFKQYVPNVPDSLFDPKTFREHLLTAIGSTASPASAETGAISESGISSIWNCLVSNLGFWVALGVVALVIVISSAIGVALVASGGTLGVAFWAAFWPALAIAGGIGASFYLITVVLVCMGY